MGSPAHAGIDPDNRGGGEWQFRFPRPRGHHPYKRTFFPAHIQAPREQPQAPCQDPEAPNPEAATETHRPQTSKEGCRSQSPTAETPSRAYPGGGRSQAAETSGLLPAEKPNPRAQGTSSALCSGKTAEVQGTGTLPRLPEPRDPGPEQVRNLRREAPASPKAGRGTGIPAKETGLRTNEVLLITPARNQSAMRRDGWRSPPGWSR